METKENCDDCPLPDTCQLGVTCEYTKRVAAYFEHLDSLIKGKGKPIMSNTSNKITVTPADVAKQAEDEKLTTEVPTQKTGKDHPQGDSSDKTTGEKAKEVVEETAEAAKKTAKTRITALMEKAKKNKKFFYGVVTGAVSTAVVLAIAAKEKAEEVVAELEIADEPDTGVDGVEIVVPDSDNS